MKCLPLMTACASMSMTLFHGAAFAQSMADAYLSKPITVIVPFAPGGPVDQETRLYTAKISGLVGHSHSSLTTSPVPEQ